MERTTAEFLAVPPREDPLQVGVDGWNPLAHGEGRHGMGRVRADPGKFQQPFQRVWPSGGAHPASSLVQPAGAVVVAQAGPHLHHVTQ